MATPLRIGVLDDSSTARMVTERLLTRAGYEVLLAENFGQLLKVIDRLDLILMDLSLGDVDGRELARSIRQLAGPQAKIPLIAVTAYADPELKESLRAAGFVDYMHKPFRPQDLYAKIEQWAGKATP